MKEIAICTATFADFRYREQQQRLIESLNQHCPEAKQFIWTDELPPGAKSHEESLYGFKVHAVKYAREQGYSNILWLDTAMICQHPVDYYFEGFHPLTAIKDDTPLEQTISDKAMRYYGNPEIIGYHLVGGSLYAFNFEQSACVDIFELWEQAERDGIFGSAYEQASEQINKHRHDESCMAMSLYLNGRTPVTHFQGKYNSGPESIFVKKHFK